MYEQQSFLLLPIFTLLSVIYDTNTSSIVISIGGKPQFWLLNDQTASSKKSDSFLDLESKSGKLILGIFGFRENEIWCELDLSPFHSFTFPFSYSFILSLYYSFFLSLPLLLSPLSISICFSSSFSEFIFSVPLHNITSADYLQSVQPLTINHLKKICFNIKLCLKYNPSSLVKEPKPTASI